jgi:predicted dehydrogenase
MLALEYGFHVLSDKPAVFSLEEAKLLQAAVKQYGKLYGLTHNYTGYPMVKQARELVQSGKLGNIRKVIVGYPQGWLHTLIEATGQKQSGWRTNSKQSGEAGCVGDIGSHAENLLVYITGLDIVDVAADLTTFVDGRELDDDASMLLRLQNGAKGILHCSQISIGHENDLYIQVYGELGSLEWHQVNPNTLEVNWPDKPKETWRTKGGSYLCDASNGATRTPSGHPEGYLEAFANVYHQFGLHILAAENGDLEGDTFDYPRITEAAKGMAFIRAAVTSSQNNTAWVNIPALLAT